MTHRTCVVYSQLVRIVTIKYALSAYMADSIHVGVRVRDMSVRFAASILEQDCHVCGGERASAARVIGAGDKVKTLVATESEVR